ncbi:hypothetical protein EBR43_09360, partial [bacterium]|nr:hypothetical protein [bacterium]
YHFIMDTDYSTLFTDSTKNNRMHLLYDVSKNGQVFRFFDGPPFATGTPHYGHILVGVVKDCILKYQILNLIKNFNQHINPFVCLF